MSHLIIHSSINGHGGCFPIWATVNSNEQGGGADVFEIMSQRWCEHLFMYLPAIWGSSLENIYSNPFLVGRMALLLWSCISFLF